MLRVTFGLAMVATLVWAWRNRTHPLEGVALRQRLGWAFGLALLLRAVLAAVRLLPPASLLAGSMLAALIGIVLFALLARLSLAEPIGRANLVYRLVVCALGSIVLLLGNRTAASIFFMLGLVRFPWLRGLTTRERLLASIACLVVVVAMLWGSDQVPGLRGAPLAAQGAARIARAVVIACALFGIDRAFRAFTSDPTLGVRRVSRRLALSHVLVVGVPLILIIALWISSTYLGVNADRALIAARELDLEGQRLEQSLRVALVSGGGPSASAKTIASANPRWPGTRVFVLRDSLVERVAGAPLPEGDDEALAAWAAGLDTLPSHGVVQLHRRRWLGAAARDSAARLALVALAPIAEPLDSTLSPMLGGSVRIAPMASASESLTVASPAAKPTKASKGPVFHTSSRRGAPVMVSTGNDTLRLDQGSIGLTGQAVVHGLVSDGTRWRPGEFALTARASFQSIVAGLYANIGENPLKVIPLLVLIGLAILLIPLGITDMNMVRGMGLSITRGIAALRDGAQAFGAGQLAHRIPIEGDDDLWDTARRFNHMAEGLERAREREKEHARVENELEVARRIQSRLLPASAPTIAGLDVAGVSESAREVGGDYYDHLDQGGGRVLLVVADVSGKGVPAALLMSGFRASLMSQDAAGAEPAALAKRLNDFLVRSVEPGKFVTAFLAYVDGGSGRLDYVNAGHNPPVVVRRDGSVELLTEGGLILGISPVSEFASGHTTLYPGDLLTLYTDGVTEGADASNEQWGEERLVASLKGASGQSAAAVAERIVREVRSFEGESGPADDITVLVARRI